ncbi:glycosyltransferase involved in cell wall biosynthesis [Methanofollis sp. W23]|uniref:glycosyltransferase family 4 protein n=1 Tax=Methanofollis sp. W23 TaxID=2817849 RepID=UPI001AEAECCD|nr:glycosyltransferase family 4 protein [Methanofollis sp. W23]MBP2146922.1 glycosyltransferase involved in cell wall biosynthesis [Methanofollis sp. W23]
MKHQYHSQESGFAQGGKAIQGPISGDPAPQGIIKKDHIVIFTAGFPPRIGGLEKIIYELSQNLVRAGYQVDVVTCNTDHAPLTEEYGEVHVLRFPSLNLLGARYPVPLLSPAALRLFIRVLKGNYQAVCTNTRFFSITLLGWCVAMIKDIPLVHLEHGSSHVYLEGRVASTLAEAYDHTVGTLIVKDAAATFGVSAAAVAFLDHLGAENPRVLHNGIDLTPFRAARTRDNGNGTHSPADITFIGRLVYGKGVQDLLAVYPSLPEGANLTIVGDGPYRYDLEEMAAGMKGVSFLGTISHDEIPKVLTSTTIFVNPSYSEGLPTSVIEACAAGCAVVATDVGGTREIITDGKNGFLVCPRDRETLAQRITFLIEHPEVARKIGASAQQSVTERFSWDVIREQWSHEIETMVRPALKTETHAQEGITPPGTHSPKKGG